MIREYWDCLFIIKKHNFDKNLDELIKIAHNIKNGELWIVKKVVRIQNNINQLSIMGGEMADGSLIETT